MFLPFSSKVKLYNSCGSWKNAPHLTFSHTRELQHRLSAKLKPKHGCYQRDPASSIKPLIHHANLGGHQVHSCSPCLLTNAANRIKMVCVWLKCGAINLTNGCGEHWMRIIYTRSTVWGDPFRVVSTHSRRAEKKIYIIWVEVYLCACAREKRNVRAAAHVLLLYTPALLCVGGSCAKSGSRWCWVLYICMYQVNRVCVCKRAAQNSGSADTQPALLMLFIATKSGFV